MRGARDTGRGSMRGMGERSSLRSNFKGAGAVRPSSLSETAKVHRAADTVREKAQAHYEKHREQWIVRQYGQLLTKSAPTLTLHPPGMAVDPKIALMHRARKEVAHRHTQRLWQIDNARKSMLTGSAMRQSRKIEWGDISAKPGTAKIANQNVDARPAAQPSRATVAKIAVAQDRARRKAEAHLVKHQEKWTGTRYNKLASAFELSKGKLPEHEAQHVRDAAMDAANRSVKAKHESRLQRIDAVCDRMRQSGNIRASRPAGRNLGLGE